MPKLVTVGTLVGTLDDVMLGLLATDATSSFIRASYTNEELLDAELLHCIKTPTPEKPFQSCGVKWHVLELTKITSKRDFVFVEASGVLDRPNGERVGYHIMHSVDLPGLGELSEKYQVLRARVVSCHLFRQVQNNTVDVFMKGLVDASGHMPAAIAIASTAGALLKLGQAVECSHSKKLEYLLELEQLKGAGVSHASARSSGHSDRGIGSFRSMKTNGSSKPCGVCSTTLHLFRSVAHCELCAKAVCSRCRVTRRLSYRVARPKELKQQNTIFCTTCVTKATAFSAAEVARAEVNAQTSAKKSTLGGLNSFASSQPRQFLASSTRSSNHTVLSSSNYSRLETSVEEDEEDDQRRSLSNDVSRVRRRSLTHPAVLNDKVLSGEKLADLDLTAGLSVVSSCSDYLDEDFYESEAGRRKTQPPSAFSDLPEGEPMDPLASSMPPKPNAPPINSHLRRQRELMRRMEELRQNAESVYQLTWRNTQSMQLQSQSVCGALADLDLDLD
ncbi:Zinc finger, RING/FYVE/PHD-type [Phytophthora cinnamomi]|uniref:Zinc finger, RING/FYVE/PHD-type n=1 Tax=Phytophthora cinnamomi TaxID=4785 RepID=UPI003559BFAB|nr:Zinc finger, RING/FYVE/PHD-type [Phytophthora cinnamomi]